MKAGAVAPRFFRDAAALRRWFAAHQATQTALLVASATGQGARMRGDNRAP